MTVRVAVVVSVLTLVVRASVLVVVVDCVVVVVPRTIVFPGTVTVMNINGGLGGISPPGGGLKSGGIPPPC